MLLLPLLCPHPCIPLPPTVVDSKSQLLLASGEITDEAEGEPASNLRGTIAFGAAGPRTRNAECYFNLRA